MTCWTVNGTSAATRHTRHLDQHREHPEWCVAKTHRIRYSRWFPEWCVFATHPTPTWAIDADGDGVREVHCNTLEGLWTGVRNFLRPFRGASKWYLAQYVAVFQWGYKLKCVTEEFTRVLLGIPPSTCFPS